MKQALARVDCSELNSLQHTINHENCVACVVMRTKTTMGITPDSSFPSASENWIAVHKTYIKKRTEDGYRQNIKTLTAFLGEIKLTDIHIGTVRAFQAQRSLKACATRTNMEVSVLQMILKEAGLWDRIGLLYRPLPIPRKKVRQNMSEEQERQLMAVALYRPKRRLAGHCLLLMANTSMGFGELRHVRREDVFLDERPFVEVNGGSKNDYRIRAITLNWIALRSMRWIVRRWQDLGGSNPNQYILPHRARVRGGPPLFDEPMGHIYRAARGILKEAGLSHLDPYDMRSHAATKILSDPECSDQVYAELVGHSSGDWQMRMRYSRQRLEKKAVVTDRMCASFVEEGKLIAFRSPVGK